MACMDDCCAVCGADIDATSPQETAEFQGQTYCFCCAECKNEFQSNPQNYALRQAA